MSVPKLGARQRKKIHCDFVIDRHGELRKALGQFVGDVGGLLGRSRKVQLQSAGLDVDVPDTARWTACPDRQKRCHRWSPPDYELLTKFDRGHEAVVALAELRQLSCLGWLLIRRHGV